MEKTIKFLIEQWTLFDDYSQSLLNFNNKMNLAEQIQLMAKCAAIIDNIRKFPDISSAVEKSAELRLAHLQKQFDEMFLKPQINVVFFL